MTAHPVSDETKQRVIDLISSALRRAARAELASKGAKR